MSHSRTLPKLASLVFFKLRNPMKALQKISASALLLIAAALVMFGLGELDSQSTFIMANFIGTVAAGIGTPTPFNAYNSVPQFLYFEIATTPQRLTVNVSGDTLICDLDTAGLNALKNPRSEGIPTNGFLIPLANGLITGKTIDITIVNNVATAFPLYGISVDAAPVDNPGFYVSLGANINAGATVILENFTYAAFPSMTAGNAANADTMNMTGWKKNRLGALMSDEWAGKIEMEGLRGVLSQYENNSVNLKVAFDNYNRTSIKRLAFTPFAAQKIYLQKLFPASSKGALQII